MKIMLTGKPGVGKSTILNKVLQDLTQNKKKVLGCVVNEIRSEEKRTGFVIQYIPSMKETMLASSVEVFSDCYLSKYSINVEGIEKELIPYMADMATSDDVDVLFFDEIGRIQKTVPQFLDSVESLLKSPVSLLATIVQADDEWARPYKSHSDVFCIEVTEENRDYIVSLIVDMLMAEEDFSQLSLDDEMGIRSFFMLFMGQCRFLELKKLFNHTIPYLCHQKAEFISDKKHYKIDGKSDVRYVVFGEDQKYQCTCLFSQGEVSSGIKRICSHIQTISIMRKDTIE